MIRRKKIAVFELSTGPFATVHRENVDSYAHFLCEKVGIQFNMEKNTMKYRVKWDVRKSVFEADPNKSNSFKMKDKRDGCVSVKAGPDGLILAITPWSQIETIIHDGKLAKEASLITDIKPDPSEKGAFFCHVQTLKIYVNEDGTPMKPK